MHRGIAAALVATAVVGLAPLGAQAATGPKGPRLTFTQGVYRGTDGGARCDHAEGYAEASAPERLTYCFTVTNTGTTPLASLRVDNPKLGGTPTLRSGQPALLAPGATVSWYLETTVQPDEADGTVDDTFVNVATVSATPADQAGKPVPITAQAGTQVYPPEIVPAPALSLHASVYAGHDGGARCPGADIPTVNPGDAITWCYVVTNTGNTRLAGVSFAELGVDGSPTLLSGSLPLAPGATGTWYLDAVLGAGSPGEVEAHPAARAAAVDDGGRELAGVTGAADSDTAALRVAAVSVGTVPATTVGTPDMVVQDPSPVAGQTTTTAAATASTAPATSTPSTTAKAKGKVEAKAKVAAKAGTKAAEAKAKAAAKPAAANKAAASKVTAGTSSELAYTGWETWFVLTLGVGLVAVGWLLTDSARRRSATVTAS